MNAEEVEVELLRTRAPQPPPELERRIMDAALRIMTRRRPGLTSALALAAACVFLAVLAFVTRPERMEEPPGKAGQDTAIQQWSYVWKKAGRDEVVATLSADSALVKDDGGKRVVEARSLTVRLPSALGGGDFVIRSDSGRVDVSTGLVTPEGNIRVERGDGFSARASSASVDLEAMIFRMSVDCMERFQAKHPSKPAQSKVEISALDAVSDGKTTTFVDLRILWKFPGTEEGRAPFSIRLEGGKGRSDEDAYSVSDNAGVFFEDGREVRAVDVVLTQADHHLRLTLSLK